MNDLIGGSHKFDQVGVAILIGRVIRGVEVIKFDRQGLAK